MSGTDEFLKELDAWTQTVVVERVIDTPPTKEEDLVVFDDDLLLADYPKNSTEG